MRILSMNCASCSAPLEIKPETTQFVCAYCGVAQIVDRSGGAVTLNLAAETLGKVQQNTDRIATELALARLYGELETLDNYWTTSKSGRTLDEVKEEIARHEALLYPKRTPPPTTNPDPPKPAPPKPRSTTICVCKYCGGMNVATDQYKKYTLWCYDCQKDMSFNSDVSRSNGMVTVKGWVSKFFGSS